MNYRVIITGATGMVGKGVLLECLDHHDIKEVLVIGRNSLGMDHPKLKEIIHEDFSDFSTIKDKLNDYDACFYCMGVSSAGMKEEKYFMWLVKLTKLVTPNSVVNTTQLGKSMINSLMHGYDKRILHAKDIITLSR
jgi:putative NADH-flavin reductase